MISVLPPSKTKIEPHYSAVVGDLEAYAQCMFFPTACLPNLSVFFSQQKKIPRPT